MMTRFLTFFFFLSLICLGIYLAQSDILHWPVIENDKKLFLSVVLLFVGFLVEAFAWFIFVRRAGLVISYTDAIVSTGLSIFGKYIPGKLWIILGRAGYVASLKGIPIERVSVYSLKCQFVSLWVASMFAGAMFIAVDSLRQFIIPMGSFIIVLSMLIFSRLFQHAAVGLVRKVLKKTIAIPLITLKDVSIVIPAYILNWLFWTASFYFFLEGSGLDGLPVYIGLAFPAAAIIGIVALFSPGGLGVREGAIALILVWAKVPDSVAATTAVSSRLWFLAGEVFIFLLAITLRFSHAEKNSVPV